MRIAHRGGEVTISNSQISVNPSGCHSFIQLVTMFFLSIIYRQGYIFLYPRRKFPPHISLSGPIISIACLPPLNFSFYSLVYKVFFKRLRVSISSIHCTKRNVNIRFLVGDIVPKFVADWRVRLGRASIILRRNRLFSHCYESRVQIVNKYVPDDHLRNSRVSEYSWKIVSF